MTEQSPLDLGDARRRRVVREDEFAAARVIGAEEQAGKWIRVDVALESHPRAALDIEHQPVTVVLAAVTGSVARLVGVLE